jgi:outer membrane protein OmpA-like peptidoglycan-associated protein
MKKALTTMTHSKLPTSSILAVGAALLAITGCATIAPNTRISDAEGRLTAAYNDKETADRSQGVLASAKMSLQTAQSDWKAGKREKSDHNLMMGQTYLDIAETRGQQGKLEKQNIALSSQAALAGKNQQIAAKDELIADKNSQLAEKNTQLADKDRQLADAQDQLRASDMKLTDLGSTMVLQDVSFETGKSQLLPGGVNRLTPLINYLRLSPQTQVRVEGYTDNVGAPDYNQRLSLDRADAVKTVLTGGGIAAERIATIGSGLSKPVATNNTQAGRQSNRRVEVTLLKQPPL